MEQKEMRELHRSFKELKSCYQNKKKFTFKQKKKQINILIPDKILN